MTSIKSSGAPLVCWDIYGSFLQEQATHTGKKSDLELLAELKQKHHWDIDFHALLKNSFYDALVLTNLNQEIIWASKGFKKMTGYSIKSIVGKKPKFLQGKETSPDTLSFIRQNIQQGNAFSTQLINYRKNGETYLCEINIAPIKNKQNQITHFIALENERPLHRK
ncbi:PAS domain-containing protein [Zhouia spongiae]|uniref:PAS domain-containing protein n=1 Tax=Zhouia spongiae TaxID=2202721 RepID=A0ABY3YMK2_9FLAO|nr:PAS domain-containing protein [Zhouia spongiae]UNY98829.1 PAS domain-containing protein [Zhouia spongiae]